MLLISHKITRTELKLIYHNTGSNKTGMNLYLSAGSKTYNKVTEVNV